jgi:Flp pilus assembly protein TadG
MASAWKTGRGQTLVEFALVLPILMLLLGGIIQYGLIFWAQNSLNQIVRDTARWAASQGNCSDPAAVIATANQVAAASTLIGYAPGSWSSSNVTVTWSGAPCPPKTNKETAWITISIGHQVPMFLPFVPGDGSIRSATQFRMEPSPK